MPDSIPAAQETPGEAPNRRNFPAATSTVAMTGGLLAGYGTLGTGKDLASYDQLRATRGLRWPVVDGKETRYRYTTRHDPYVEKAKGAHYNRAKGYGERAAFWLWPYHPPTEVPDGEYPFWLTTGRVPEHWHTGSMTRRVKQLHQAVSGAYVEMNRVDATALGVTTGDKVGVVSRRGKLELNVQMDGRGRPPRGVLFVPRMAGHVLEAADRTLLLGLQRLALDYFLDNQAPSGLVFDRQANHGPRRPHELCSLTATGMGFIALALASTPPYRLLSPHDAARRIAAGLRTALERLPHDHGVVPPKEHRVRSRGVF